MNYDSDEHSVAGRQVVAGWIVCLVIIGLALGLMGKHESAPEAVSTPTWQIATMGGHDPLSGAHIPRFVQCCSRIDKPLLAAAERWRSAVSSPTGGCG